MQGKQEKIVKIQHGERWQEGLRAGLTCHIPLEIWMAESSLPLPIPTFLYFYLTLFSFFLQREISWYLLLQEREKQKFFPGLYVAKSLIDDVNFRSHKWVYFIWCLSFGPRLGLFFPLVGWWLLLGSFVCVHFFNRIHLNALDGQVVLGSLQSYILFISVLYLQIYITCLAPIGIWIWNHWYPS